MMKTTEKRGIRQSGAQVVTERLDISAMRNKLQASTPEEGAGLIQNMTASTEKAKQFRLDHDSDRLHWRTVRNIKHVQEAFEGAEVRLEIPTQTRAVLSSAFPAAISNMNFAMVNEAYLAVPTIGQELVSELDDVKEVSTIPDVVVHDNAVERKSEGEDYSEVGGGELKYQVLSKHNGRITRISQKLIDQNDIPGIVTRLDALGTIAAELIEELTIKLVFDKDGSATTPKEPYVFRDKGGPAAIYRTTGTGTFNRLPSTGNRYENNAFADESDLENARKRLTSMKNHRGKPLLIDRSQYRIVFPDALLDKVLRILHSEDVPASVGEHNRWGPLGQFKPLPITSPYIDDLINVSTWLFGAPQLQYVRKWGLRPEIITVTGMNPGNAGNYLNARIGYTSRIAWDVWVGARDYVYVVQNLDGSTAP